MSETYEMVCPTCWEANGDYQGPTCDSPEGNERTGDWFLSHVAENEGHHPIIKDTREAL